MTNLIQKSYKLDKIKMFSHEKFMNANDSKTTEFHSSGMHMVISQMYTFTFGLTVKKKNRNLFDVF